MTSTKENALSYDIFEILYESYMKLRWAEFFVVTAWYLLVSHKKTKAPGFSYVMFIHTQIHLRHFGRVIELEESELLTWWLDGQVSPTRYFWCNLSHPPPRDHRRSRDRVWSRRTSRSRTSSGRSGCQRGSWWCLWSKCCGRWKLGSTGQIRRKTLPQVPLCVHSDVHRHCNAKCSVCFLNYQSKHKAIYLGSDPNWLIQKSAEDNDKTTDEADQNKTVQVHFSEFKISNTAARKRKYTYSPIKKKKKWIHRNH